MNYGRTGLRQHVGEPAKAPPQATRSHAGAVQPTRSYKLSLPGFAQGHRVRRTENVNDRRVDDVSAGDTASKGYERETVDRSIFAVVPTRSSPGLPAADRSWSDGADLRVQCPTSNLKQCFHRATRHIRIGPQPA